MNNQTKIIVTITGIPGATLHQVKMKIPFALKKKELLLKKGKRYKGKDSDKIVYKGIRKVWDLIAVPCSKTIKFTQDAYDYMTSKETPYWYYKKDWTRLKPIQRLELHLQRTCLHENGETFTYSILDD